jgi:hypothetical protein
MLFHAEAIVLERVINAQIIRHRGLVARGRRLSG